MAGRGSAPAGVPAGVLALQGDVAEHLAALAAAGAAGVAVRRPAELDAVAGLVIPGGESTAIWKLAEACGLAGPLRDRVGAGMPVLGCCAGMILLAARLAGSPAGQQTLGAIDMTVRRNAFGRQRDSFETDLQLRLDGTGGRAGPHAADRAAAGGPLRAVFIRAPWVDQHGPQVQVLAVEPAAGKPVAVRQGPALATAFHPELTPDRRIHQLFIDIIKDTT
jgi:pyridoxal 5'-phosphate synthase pdxT subunit